MIYAAAFLAGVMLGLLTFFTWSKMAEKRRIEIETFLNETPKSKFVKAFTTSNKLKPKVNNDERAVERELAF